MENLSCPVCREIYRDPVILSCSHSFCRECLQRCRANSRSRCPICRRSVSLNDPPQNLALKNLCEAYSQQRRGSGSGAPADLCSLHSETLRLFCLDHQQPACVVCLHSDAHKSHKFKPIDEAARDHKAGLRDLLKPLREKEELFSDIIGNFNQIGKDIEVQGQEAERQIRDVFRMLREFLQEEEQMRLSALRKEWQQKSEMMRKEKEAASWERATLSDTIRATEDELTADDVSFLRNYKTAAERVQRPQPVIPDHTSGTLIDVGKHLNNLSFAVLDKMKGIVSSNFNPDAIQQRPRSREIADLYAFQKGTWTRRPYSLALPERQTEELLDAIPKPTYAPPSVPSWRAPSKAGSNDSDRIVLNVGALKLGHEEETPPSKFHEELIRKKAKGMFKVPRK